MSEKSLVNYTLGGMRRRWRKPIKHADGFTAGIADLSAWIEPAGNIWIECKALKKWPRMGPVKFGLDDLQKDFLLERRGWCFVRVGREYLLFNYRCAHDLLDTPGADRVVLTMGCAGRWTGKVDWKEFAKLISKRRP